MSKITDDQPPAYSQPQQPNPAYHQAGGQGSYQHPGYYPQQSTVYPQQGAGHYNQAGGYYQPGPQMGYGTQQQGCYVPGGQPIYGGYPGQQPHGYCDNRGSKNMGCMEALLASLACCCCLELLF